MKPLIAKKQKDELDLYLYLCFVRVKCNSLSLQSKSDVLITSELDRREINVSIVGCVTQSDRLVRKLSGVP